MPKQNFRKSAKILTNCLNIHFEEELKRRSIKQKWNRARF